MSTKTNSSFRFDLNPTAENNINVPEVGGSEQFLPKKGKISATMTKKPTWDDHVAKGNEMGYDLNALATEVKGLDKGSAEYNEKQNLINEIMGSNVRHTEATATGDDQGPTDDVNVETGGDTVEQALSRRELRQQARRDRKTSRIENLQRKRANLSEAGDAKYERLLNREHRMAKRQQNVGEGARKFRERRDKVMNSIRDSKVGRFFKGNTSS